MPSKLIAIPTRKRLLRFGFPAAAGALALGLVAAQAAAPGHAVEPASYSASDPRYARAVDLDASELLHATLYEAQDRSAGRITKIAFDEHGRAQWVWVRFDGMFGGWSLRAPVGSLYFDRAQGRLRTDRSLEELRRLAEADPETSASTATAIPARFAPASRLMGLQIVGVRDDRVGRVHSVHADASGAADALVVERRFGLFHAKSERYVVPADQIFYLPVTQQLVIDDLPQPTLASLSETAG